jgi:hypothetical protein
MFHRYLVLLLLISGSLLIPGSLLISGSLLAQQTNHKSKSTIVMPKVGTMIVNTYYVTDSAGALVPKSVADPNLNDDTLFFTQTGVKLYGRTNCAVLVAKSHPDTTLISYTSKGDVYLRVLGTDSSWNKLPLGMVPGTHTTQILPKDSGTYFGHDYNMPHQRTYEALGHDTVTIQGKVMDCIKLKIIDEHQYMERDWQQGALYWWSPELGYYARMNMGWNGPYFLNQQLKIYQ